MAIPERLDCDGEMTGSSLVGAILATRYKILGPVDEGCFRAHDLDLDQTVTVRQTFFASRRDGNSGYQKVRHLALVRDPRFLNVLDVIFDKSSVFIITERSRGYSVADLLRERPRLELKDVLRLVTPLAGALDLAAVFSCSPNPISTRWLFTETMNSAAADQKQRSFSDWPFPVKLDIWELVKPGKSNPWRLLTSRAQWGDPRELAVRQAALLTYELLGGEINEKGHVKRWFKPVKGLGNAGNSILRRGLLGSPLFASSGCFFHKLKSAIQSGEREPRALPALATQEKSAALPGTSDMIRRFNRDTGWLAMGVLGAVIFAALALALLVQEHHPKVDDLTEEARLPERDLFLNANPANRFTVVGSNRNSSAENIISGQESSVDHALPEISPQENHSLQMETTASTSTPVLAIAPEKNHTSPQPNITSWSPVIWQAPERVIQSKIRNRRERSPVVLRTVDVKRRLIALWHQSLAQSEKSRNWTAFSNLNKGVRKKAAYTAESNH